MNRKESSRFYEQVLVLHPDSSEKEQKSICQAVASVIEKQKGQIFRVDTWGSRLIANPKARGVSRAWYFYMLFSGSSDVVTEVRKHLSINSKVLYFHQEKLPKTETPEKHIQKFIQNLEQTAQKEKERTTRNQKKQTWASKV